MSVQKELLYQFKVEVKTRFVPEESAPEQGQFFFAYKIKVSNLGSHPSQLVSRHWIIVDNRGRKEEVRGAGVVGLQPRIMPGQSFEYESACPLMASSGSMKGRFFMKADGGEHFEIEVPEFYLVAPQALH